MKDLEDWFATNGTCMMDYTLCRPLMKPCSICGKPFKNKDKILVEQARYEKVHQYHMACWEFLKGFIMSLRDSDSATSKQLQKGGTK